MARSQLQADDAYQQKRGRQHAPDIGGIPKPQDAHHERAQSADARPHGISRAYGDVPLRQPQQEAAQSHAEHGERNAGGKPAAPRTGGLGKLETQRPSDLAETSQHQINPGHILK